MRVRYFKTRGTQRRGERVKKWGWWRRGRGCIVDGAREKRQEGGREGNRFELRSEYSRNGVTHAHTQRVVQTNHRNTATSTTQSHLKYRFKERASGKLSKDYVEKDGNISFIFGRGKNVGNIRIQIYILNSKVYRYVSTTFFGQS